MGRGCARREGVDWRFTGSLSEWSLWPIGSTQGPRQGQVYFGKPPEDLPLHLLISCGLRSEPTEAKLGRHGLVGDPVWSGKTVIQWNGKN